MDNTLKEIPASKKKTDLLLGGILTLLAFVVYCCTISHGAFPGSSAQLIVSYTGLESLELPLHPMFAACVNFFSSIPLFPLPLRLNLFSLLCTVASVWMIYRIISFFIFDIITEEFSLPHAPKAAFIGGVVATFCYIFSIPVWNAATHLQFQSFDAFLLISCFALLVAYAKTGKGFILIIFALLWGAGTAESVLFIPFGPVVLAALIYILVKTGKISLGRVAWILALALVSGLALYWFSARGFLKSADAQFLAFKENSDVLLAVWKNQVRQVRQMLPPVSWLIFFLMGTLPCVIAVSASFRALNNDRNISQYALHFALFVLIILNLTNVGISPWGIVGKMGRLPIASYVMTAIAAGYLAAYLYLLIKVERSARGQSTNLLVKQIGHWMGILMLFPVLIITFLTAVVNAFNCSGNRGAFADRSANEILDRLDGRTWLITDGTLDNHLLISAHERKIDLNLICLQNDMDEAYLKRMARLVKEKNLFSEKDARRMSRSLELGLLPFIQDWFLLDPKVQDHVAVFGVPDFWYSQDRVPVPEFFFFSGSTNPKEKFKGRKLYEEYSAFWEKMEKVLPPVDETERMNPLLALRAYLRRHLGFVANNLGVMLEDIGQEEDAFKTYRHVHEVIDKGNISALFNLFEMARRGAPCAQKHKEMIERELKDFVTNLKRTYPLWSLSRYFGYVRSPEIFAKLGWGWALSGQTGAALAGVKRAIQLLPGAKRNEASQAIAAIYAMSNDKSKSVTLYQQMIKANPNDRSALLGLAQLSMREGEMDQAKSWLEKAVKIKDKDASTGIEWAVIHLMNNDLPQARLALQRTTDLQPKNLQAWSMLALVQLQQNEVEELERVTLPRMESIAGTVDNYFIQITRASLALKRVGDTQAEMEKTKKTSDRDSPREKKILGFQRQAREGFLRASALRPDVEGLKDRILSLDIAMNDQPAAELHARQVLRVNRKHSLANYVLGSLRLQEGQYGAAEDFLRMSVEAKPTPAALNDLAEALRRIKKLNEAEKFARDSIKLNKNLYISWETLACIILEKGGDLNEAESCIKQSLKLYSGDLRVKITEARIVLKKGEIERARQLIHKIRGRQSELSPFDLEVLNKLSEQAASARK